MKILETQFKRRAYDGKFERIAKVIDEENKYSYKSDTGKVVWLIPTKWITIGVYDYLFDLEA